MSDIPRITVSELLAKYELEPGLRDVFVEGGFDREVLSRCLWNAGRTESIVYEIDSVEISAQRLVENGLTEGNKQRVIALARALATIAEDCSYRCIVDRDLDHWLGDLETTPRLRWTAHCSLELYFFSDEVLHDVLFATARAKIGSWNKFRVSFVATLHDLFALRLADRELGWSLKWISFDRCLASEGDHLTFDSKDYLKRLLLKNKKSQFADQLAAKVTEWRQRLSGDPRAAIRGHDFVELLAWVIGNFGGIKQFADVIALERIFVLIANKAAGLLELLD